MIRLLFCLGLLSLLTWLSISPTPRNAQWSAITAAYDRAEIGRLPPSQQAALQETVAWLVKYANVTQPVSVNERPVRGRLNVITTSAAAIAITGCASGNAIYDRSLDIIFIDEHIAWARDIPLLGNAGPRTMYTSEYLGFPDVYLRFVLLHELGHRALHQRNATMFDAENVGRRWEEEADLFAINALRNAYAASAAGSKRLGRGAASSLSLNANEVSPADRMWADLLGAMNSMSVALLYSTSDFSSLYQDDAHPTFLDRASRIFSLALHSNEISDRLKVHAAYHLENLRRTREIPINKMSESKFPFPMQGVSFDEGRLVTLTDHGHLYATPLSANTNLQDWRGATAGTIIATGPFELPDEFSWLSSVWVSRAMGPLVLRGAPELGEKHMDVVRPDGHGSYAPADTLRSISGEDAFGEKIAAAPQPSPAAVLGVNTRSEGKYWIIKDGEPVLTGNWKSLRDRARAALRSPNAEIDLMNVTDREAYLSISDAEGGRERLRAVMILDLASNAPTSIRPLMFMDEEGADQPGLPGDRLVAVPSMNGRRFFVVTRARDHFLVFELFESQPMREIASQAFMLKHMPGTNATSDLIAAFDPKLADAQWVPPNHLAVVFNRDSIYSINTDSGKVRRLLNPGDGVQMAVGSAGYVAFFMRNGYKVYTHKMEKE